LRMWAIGSAEILIPAFIFGVWRCILLQTPNMKAACSSETSASVYQSTRRLIPKTVTFIVTAVELQTSQNHLRHP
jgi:hypothetical protein